MRGAARLAPFAQPVAAASCLGDLDLGLAVSRPMCTGFLHSDSRGSLWMSGSIKVEAKGDLLIVSEPTSNFVAIYVRPNERPRLTLMRRTPTTDNVLLAEAFQAAVSKARELGWIV